MKLDNVDSEYAIYGMLFSLSNRIQTIGDKAFQNITLKQQFLMIALQMFPQPPTLKQMGDLIGCSYQNVKRMADQLKQKGYILIEQDQQDHRKLLLYSTGKFEQEAEMSRDKTVEFMQLLYQGISKDNLDITLNTLKRMDQNIGGLIE